MIHPLAAEGDAGCAAQTLLSEVGLGEAAGKVVEDHIEVLFLPDRTQA